MSAASPAAINIPNVQPHAAGLASVNPIFTWVRLAQRVPVRIHIDQVPDGVRLVAGMTAAVQIDLRPAPPGPWLANQARCRSTIAEIPTRENQYLSNKPSPQKGCSSECGSIDQTKAVDRFRTSGVSQTARKCTGVSAPPQGVRWNASTIHRQRSRGNGMLLNEIYIGQIVWNKVRMIKDPTTGKRVSRPNPASQHKRVEAPIFALLMTSYGRPCRQSVL
jgi:hypothetical protein